MKDLLLNSINYLLKPLTNNFFEELSKNSKVNQLIKLYPNDKFIKIRFWDAPYLEVETIISKNSSIIDLGCGDGFFANFLAISSKKRKVFGIEINKSRIISADKGLQNTRFLSGDITKTKLPKTDVVVLFHVLHHLTSFKTQNKLLNVCSKQLKKNGKLIIVEVEPKISYRYLIAWLVDHFLVPWIFDRKFYSPIYFRRGQDWVTLLNQLAFKTKVTNLERDKPFSHVLIEATKT